MIDPITRRLSALPDSIKQEIIINSLLSTAAAIAGLGAPFFQIGNRLFDNGLSSLACSVSFSCSMSTYWWLSYSMKKKEISDRLSQVISMVFALICGTAVYLCLDSFSMKAKFLVASVNILTHTMLCFALKNKRLT